MKPVYLLLFLCCCLSARAQVQLRPDDFNNLVTLSNIYAASGGLREGDIPAAQKLRSPALNRIIDILVSSSKGDSSIMQRSYQVRPAHEEMMLWYAMDQVNENRHDTIATHKPTADLIKAALAQNADDRTLLDCYYSFHRNGLGRYFNTADLSRLDIDLNNMGFKNETEKAIYYFHLMNGFTYGRFRVLNYLKKQETLIQVANRLPMFNGKKYYEYTHFDYDDFIIGGLKDTTTFNALKFNMLYETLLLHFNALASTGDKQAARALYFNSILHEPRYFNYSKDLKTTLNSFYSQSN